MTLQLQTANVFSFTTVLTMSEFEDYTGRHLTPHQTRNDSTYKLVKQRTNPSCWATRVTNKAHGC